jgi:hypothetical protein
VGRAGDVQVRPHQQDEAWRGEGHVARRRVVAVVPAGAVRELQPGEEGGEEQQEGDGEVEGDQLDVAVGADAGARAPLHSALGGLLLGGLRVLDRQPALAPELVERLAEEQGPPLPAGVPIGGVVLEAGRRRRDQHQHHDAHGTQLHDVLCLLEHH